MFHHLCLVPVTGHYAVQGFFVLSGFLMTLVMHSSYGYSAGGRLAFAANRPLRLYPSFWIAVIIALLVVAVTGETAARNFRAPIYLPHTPGDWLQNATMVYWALFPEHVMPRLVPATWAITIELFYYALICIGISRNRTVTWIWFAASVAYGLYVYFTGLGYGYRYFILFAGSLPFSMGALIYHYRNSIRPPVIGNITGGVVASLALIGLSAGSLIAQKFRLMPFEAIMFYGNVGLAVAAVAFLYRARGDKALDSRIGDYSYHIYILHWPVGLLISNQLFGLSGPSRSLMGLAAAVVTLLACAAISSALTRWIDQPVERMRRAFRGRRQARLAARSQP